MISDDERREVARRLRGLEVCELDGEFIDCGEVEYTLGLVSDDGAWYEAEGVMRLADLIEPPARCPHYHSDRHYCSVHEDTALIDRDALLALADEMQRELDECASDHEIVGKLQYQIDRIREALGGAE